jgi:tetratricopeptide (TPR) repeat protein
MMLRIACALQIVTVLAIAPVVRAHEDAADRLHAIGHRLEATPDDPGLYLERAGLLRERGRPVEALEDCRRARALSPSAAASADLIAAGIHLEDQRPEAALDCARRVLLEYPEHGPAHLARARALRYLGRKSEAIATFEMVRAGAETPRPELVLEHAGLHLDAPRSAATALGVLDEGMARIGPAPALVRLAIELEVELGRVEAALDRIDDMVRRSRRPERWLVRRGELMEEAGRCEEAAGAYRAALRAVDRLPPRHRRTAAVTALEMRALAGLAGVAPDHVDVGVEEGASR